MSAVTSTQVKIDPLEGSGNYEAWKRVIEAVLIREDLWEIVIGESTEPELTPSSQLSEEQRKEDLKQHTEWKRSARRAYATLTLAITPEVGNLLAGTTDPHAMWKKLEELYAPKGRAAKHMLLRDIVSSTLDASSSVSEYIDNIKKNARRLSNMGAIVPEWMLVSFLIFGLNDAYSTLVTVLENSSRAEDLTLDEAVNALLEESRRKELHEDPVALLMKRTTKQANSKNSTNHCSHCRKDGHIAERCWKLHPELRPNNASNKQNERQNDKAEAYVAIPSSSSSRFIWHMDSGATNHICQSKDDFVTYTPETSTITVGGQNAVNVLGRGTARIEFQLSNGSINEVHLTNTLHAPTFGTNVVSATALTSKGLSISLAEPLCQVRRPNGTVLAEGKKHRGLIRLSTSIPLKRVESAVAHYTNAESNSARLWHRRLGHIGYNNLRQLSNIASGIDLGSNFTEEKCETCHKGKQTKTPSRQPSQATSECLELVHSDVCGPITPTSLGGAKYFVTFIDDYTRHIWLYPIKEKSQCFPRFKEFKEAAEKASGHQIKRLRSDNGGEYNNNAFKAYLRSAGIQWEPTVPYAPEQNGLAERINRSIAERVRCMLIDGNVPKFLWAEAANTAVYLLNRSPASSIGITPHEAWHGRRPNLSYVRIFGCVAFAHTPSTPSRKKLDDRSIPCQLLGYEGSHQYRLYDPATRSVRRVRDVVFDETTLKEWRAPEATTPAMTANTESISAHNNSSQENEQEDEPTSLAENTDNRPEEETSSEEALIELPTRASARSSKGIPPVRYEEEFPGTTARGRLQAHSNTAIATRKSITLIRESEGSQLGSEDDEATEQVANNAQAYLSAHSPAQGANPYIDEPTSFHQAQASSQKDEWNAAMRAEIDALNKNKTWSIVALPPGRKALRGRWVYRAKRGPDGTIIRYKARWVVKGYEQQYGIDYIETFASVVKPMVYKALFAIAAALNYEIEQMDFITAFLNGLLKEVVYVEQPHGFKEGDGVCILHRALYGLRQSPRVWYETLYMFLASVGYKRISADYSVFTHANGTIVAVYVDDLQIFGPSMKDIQALKKQLTDQFSMTDLGPATHYLGIQITRDRQNRLVRLSQEAYIQKVLQTFGMADCQPVSTPMEPSLHLVKEEGITATPESIRAYQSAVGSLMYAMLATRPDLAFSISTLSQFAANPNESHWKALKRCFRYLKGTADLGLVYGPDINETGSLVGYTDADWAGDRETRKSTTGYAFMLGGGAISWTSKRQQTVALSSCEAEYMAASQAAKEALWLRHLLTELGYTGKDIETVTIHADNQGAIALAKNPEHHARSKHIDVRYHFIREHIEAKKIKLNYISTHDMAADGLTKPLPRLKFQEFVAMLGMRRDCS